LRSATVGNRALLTTSDLNFTPFIRNSDTCCYQLCVYQH